MDETPLHKAETAEEVEAALDAGWAVDHSGWMGGTPLHRAAERGLPEVVLGLIRRGANVNARRPERKDTPLHFAADAQVASLLIEHGSEVEALDWSGRSPLHWAAQFGRPDVAALLIQNGAVVDRPANDGAAPLHWASQEDHAEVVRVFLRAGAEVDRRDVHGRTPLHRAAWRGHAEIIDILLGAGADPDLRNVGGQTPLHEAESSGREAVVKRLAVSLGGSARADRILSEAALTRIMLGLTKIRMHPMRPEAIAVAEQATLFRWKLGEPPEVVAGLQSHHAWFPDLAAAPQSDLFAVTTLGQTIELRRWDDLRVEQEVSCPTAGPHGLAALDLSPDGRWIAVADSAEELHLIERATGRVVATQEAGERTYCVRFDPTSRLLAVACSFQGGGHVRIDRIDDGGLTAVAQLGRSDHRTPGKRFVDTLAHLAFSPGSGFLALFETSAIYHDARPRGWRGDVALYETGTWSLRWTASVDAKATGDARPLPQAGHEMGFLTEIVFVDDETLACGSTKGCVLFYRVSDGKLQGRVQIHPEAPVTSLAVDATRRTLWAALGAGGGTLVHVPL